jgi:hypothetical protein
MFKTVSVICSSLQKLSSLERIEVPKKGTALLFGNACLGRDLEYDLKPSFKAEEEVGMQMGQIPSTNHLMIFYGPLE